MTADDRDDYRDRAPVEFDVEGDDGQVLTLDLSDFDENAPHDDSDDREDDELMPPADEPEPDAPDERLPDGFDAWTDANREGWAANPDLSQHEAKLRRRLLFDWLSAHPEPGRRERAVASSGWGDVSLDSILDGIANDTLVLPRPTVGMLDDGSAGLFYPGRVNGLAGESGAGKGWIALATAAERMRDGCHAFYVDFEDAPALVALRLVKVLGVDPRLVRDLFHYAHPTRHDDDAIRDLVDRVSETPGAFVVIDSVGESMALAGKNGDRDGEVADWMQSIAHPLADRGGATVLLLDHLVKSLDGGLWPSGSQRKRAAITGAQYIVEVVDPYSKSTNGMVAVKVAKDRHGFREARSVATYARFEHPVESVTIDPTTGDQVVRLGEALTVVFGTGRTASQSASDKAARAAQALDADVANLDAMTPSPTSYRDVKQRLGWKDDRAQAAMREWRKRRQP